MFRFAIVSFFLTTYLGAAPEALTWGNFDEVSEYVALKPGDLNYQKVQWHSTVIEGQREAQKQDKPLLLWLYFGDPRANC